MTLLLPGMEAEQRNPALSQWYTPPGLAVRLRQWMLHSRVERPIRLLEPAAGRGALVAPFLASGQQPVGGAVYDIDPTNVAALHEMMDMLAYRGHQALDVRHRDFLTDAEPGRFDLCVMNPPFEGNQDTAFAAAALECSDRVGGVFAARILHSQERLEFWRWTDIRRLVVLSSRPRFGGEHTPMTDFVLLDLRRRASSRKQGDPSTTNVEWW